jgi:type IV pilus assembly protein PilB
MLRFFTQKQIRQVLVEPSKLDRLLKPYDQKEPEATQSQSLDELLAALKDIQPEEEEEERVVEVNPKDSGVMRVVNYILLESIRMGASDIHIEPNGRERDVGVRLRVDGRCFTAWKLPPPVRLQIVSRIKIMANISNCSLRPSTIGKSTN